jgi:hypothetical protein
VLGLLHTAEGPGDVAMDYAMARIGLPYLWVGTGPAAYDCSRLVMQAWEAATGANPPRVATDQYTYGTKVNTAALIDGELVYWASNPPDPTTIEHVAMYIGGGHTVNAPYTGAEIRTDWIGGTGFVALGTRPLTRVYPVGQRSRRRSMPGPEDKPKAMRRQSPDGLRLVRSGVAGCFCTHVGHGERAAGKYGTGRRRATAPQLGAHCRTDIADWDQVGPGQLVSRHACGVDTNAGVDLDGSLNLNLPLVGQGDRPGPNLLQERRWAFGGEQGIPVPAMVGESVPAFGGHDDEATETHDFGRRGHSLDRLVQVLVQRVAGVRGHDHVKALTDRTH